MVILIPGIVLAASAAAAYAMPPRVFAPTRGSGVTVSKFGYGTPGGYNTTYGYPDGIGGLIVEGPFQYENGPLCWSPTTPWGAYGMIIAPGSHNKHHTCTPIPAASPLAKTGLTPVPLTDGIKDCLVGCNITEVKITGIDPCHAASVTDTTNSVMSCFDLGPGTVKGAGACGYNCSVFHEKLDGNGRLQPCTSISSDCFIYCDTRTFPNTSIELLAANDKQ